MVVVATGCAAALCPAAVLDCAQLVVVARPRQPAPAARRCRDLLCCEQEKLPRLAQHHQPSTRLNNYNTSSHLHQPSTRSSGGLNKHRGAPQSHLRCGVKYFLVVREYFPADVEQEHYLARPVVTSGDHLNISPSPVSTHHLTQVSSVPGPEMKSPLSFRRTRNNLQFSDDHDDNISNITKTIFPACII